MIITNFNNLMTSTFHIYFSLFYFLERLGCKVKPCYTSITRNLSSILHQKRGQTVLSKHNLSMTNLSGQEITNELNSKDDNQNQKGRKEGHIVIVAQVTVG